jgi:predicted adenine nucleotide alpha hydrolase (AANH) superfamily ATPase
MSYFINNTHNKCRYCNISLIDNIYNSNYCGSCQFSVDSMHDMDDNNNTTKMINDRADTLLERRIR